MIHPPPFPRLQSITVFAVMLQMLLLQAMAASGDLHKHFHDHADDPAHQCAVTLMLHGGYASVAPDIAPVNVLPEPPPGEVVIAPVTRISEPAHLVGGVLAHAPPRGP